MQPNNSVNRFDQSDARAPDMIYCKGCRRNHDVFIDKARHLKSFLASWLFEFYFCRKCDCKFTTLGLPLVTMGAFLAGGLLLTGFQVLR